MSFNPELQENQIIDNTKLVEIFKCSTQGGMRRSNETNTLVLVSNHVKSIYDDRWEDGALHYTGMGMKSDQSLDFMQNKTLAQSGTNGVDLFLFEVFKEKEYTFIGQVQLAADPYQESQLDEEGNTRKVWIFPLKPIDYNTHVVIDQATLDELYTTKIKEAKRLSDEDLKRRAEATPKKRGQRNATVIQHDRSPWISEYAKRRANGICQLCLQPAPFNNGKGEPYLETHHIIWLAKGGEDSIENTVALCPNCHKKMHIVNAQKDIEKLKQSNLACSD
jgi:5-methylcytosine-specific restriction protein A